MAAAGRPVSELFPLGGAVSMESTLFDSGHTPQEEPKEASTELCKERPTTPPRETNCSSLRVSEDPDERSCTQRSVEMSCELQCAGAPHLATNHLTLPRLISSVSETGLDAKHLLRCCSCSPIRALRPAAGPPSLKLFGLDSEECCSVRTATRDTGTMTAHKELKEVGVQTGQTVSSHVFLQICPAERRRRETSCTQTPNTHSDGGKKLGGAPKSPVKEVKWDAEGMTWEVYGASVDPEELGLAIQRHLELQIRETASRAAKLSRQNTNASRQGGDGGRQRKRSRMTGSIRTPACCARSSTAD